MNVYDLRKWKLHVLMEEATRPPAVRGVEFYLQETFMWLQQFLWQLSAPETFERDGFECHHPAEDAMKLATGAHRRLVRFPKRLRIH